MPRTGDPIRYLYDLQRFGVKAGLKNISLLVSALGHPETKFPAVHIAGTNGKGSTSAMIASILTASGYRTGLYTSPHLISFSERIRIDGVPISDNTIRAYTQDIRPLVDTLQATFFEATTAIAFRYFAEEKVDVAVIETGLGGRLDATNVITPLLSVITSIGIDHAEYLGSTLPEIAREKGGIIKEHIPCIAGKIPARAKSVLRSIARNRQAPFIDSVSCSGSRILKEDPGGMVLSISAGKMKFESMSVPLVGEHQVSNLALALLTAGYLRSEYAFGRIRNATIRNGLANVRKLSGIRGRLDYIGGDPPMIADVAHNPDGIKALVKALRRLLPAPAVVLFGVMRDKDYQQMLSALKGIARRIVAVQPSIPRALESRHLTGACHNAGISAQDGGDVENGLRAALACTRPGEPLIATGSHYLVGEVLKLLKILR